LSTPSVHSPDRAHARVLAVVQARTSSTRLPGKVLADVGGVPALELMLDRLRKATELDEVVVATSTDGTDDAVAELVANVGAAVVRGPLDDVLGRFALALEQHPAQAIVRLTGDCPLVDPGVVDAVVRRWRAGEEAYVTNVGEPRTFPDGLDVEVVSRAALEEAANEAVSPEEREHVTAFVRARAERFPEAVLELEPDYGWVRITLDTVEDLERIRQIVTAVGADGGFNDVLAFLGLGPAVILAPPP
jgi:spore coat polysaccharide biosynthesis protein SpsF (cytidylyltransferase family)